MFFTGSYATGTSIGAKAGRKMIKVQLELGGKDPVYVCDDVDVATAAAGIADGAFYNTGQSCCSVERIYVHEEDPRRLRQGVRHRGQGVQDGRTWDESTYIGAITRGLIDVLKKQVADAKKRGAKLLTGGNVVQRKRQLVRADGVRRRQSQRWR